MKLWPGSEVRLGADGCIDEDVILGYPCGRLPQGGVVTVGNRSKIRSGSVIYQAVTIGSEFESGHHVVIREQNKIGDRVAIWSNTLIDYGCVIGNGVKIHVNGYIAQYSVIEDDVFLAPGVIFGNDKYPVSPLLEGPRIGKGASIGVNVTILPGVVIGAGALVGAGSVVTKDVPSGVVVAGNPARVVTSQKELLKKKEAYLAERMPHSKKGVLS